MLFLLTKTRFFFQLGECVVCKSFISPKVISSGGVRFSRRCIFLCVSVGQGFMLFNRVLLVFYIFTRTNNLVFIYSFRPFFLFLGGNSESYR